MPSTLLRTALLLSISCYASAQSSLTTQDVLAKAKSANVSILTGEGAGRLQGIATGVIVSPDGLILTALHVIKNASEVQVRLANGEVFDRVQLLGSDERRDIAALKISARGLPFLEPSSGENAPGDPIYAVTSANGLEWSATSGIVSAVRPADEVSGAGIGFRLIQFSASIAPGASGGALVSSDGKLLGIITRGTATGMGFAVPAQSVMGLSESGHPVLLGSGALLQTPARIVAATPASSAAIASTDPKQLLKDAKTLYLHSKTSFLTIDTLQRDLLASKLWPELGLTIVQDPRLGDLVIEVDRPLFTYVHTFVLSDKKTTIVLGSGKQTAFDGTIASAGLSKDIVKILATTRIPKAISR